MTTITISESPISVSATDSTVTIATTESTAAVSVVEGAAVNHDHDGDYDPAGSAAAAQAAAQAYAAGLVDDLSGVSDAVTARGNLGLGTAAVEAAGAFAAASHAHAASDTTSGTFADARISESSVTQHQGALTVTESQISDLGDYEPNLGNPGTDGYVLSSTAAGVRSWIEMMAGGGGVEFPWQPDSDGTHSILQNAAGTNDVLAVDTSSGDIIVDGDASFRPDANTTNWGFLADASGTPFAFADTTNKEVRFGVGTDVLFIGPSAGRSSSGTSVVAIGPFAAFSNTGNGILAFGQAAGQQNTGTGGTYIGLNSGKSSSATNAVGLGRDTGESASGLNPIFIGAYAGKGASNATNVTAIGFYAYQGATGTFNVAIGEEAGRSSNAGSCVYIGRLQGKSNTTSNRLLVGNNSTLSLLDGTMGTTTAAQALKINANTITLGTLPTSDPAVAGQLWNDGGTVKISAG